MPFGLSSDILLSSLCRLLIIKGCDKGKLVTMFLDDALAVVHPYEYRFIYSGRFIKIGFYTKCYQIYMGTYVIEIILYSLVTRVQRSYCFVETITD